LTTAGDTQIVVTRRFAAPPESLYRAHTEPALLPQTRTTMLATGMEHGLEASYVRLDGLES